jgi:phasin family protein
MEANLDSTVMQTWKVQLDMAMRVTEAIIEGSTRMHEVQIEAATDAHADAVATQRSLAAAQSPADLLRIQTEWLAANQRKSLAYWRHLYEAAADTHAQLMCCVRDAVPREDEQAARRANSADV